MAGCHSLINYKEGTNLLPLALPLLTVLCREKIGEPPPIGDWANEETDSWALRAWILGELTLVDDVVENFDLELALLENALPREE